MKYQGNFQLGFVIDLLKLGFVIDLLKLGFVIDLLELSLVVLMFLYHFRGETLQPLRVSGQTRTRPSST